MSALVLSLLSIVVLITPAPALASVANAQLLDLPSHGVGYAGIVIFTLAYAFVMAEEFTHLRQVKPTILVAGILSAMLAGCVRQSRPTRRSLSRVASQFAGVRDLFLFLLVAMTYINSLEERQVFDALTFYRLR